MQGVNQANDLVSVLVMVQFKSGKHHVGALGRYLESPDDMQAALDHLDEYLNWGRAYLGRV